MNGRKAGNTGRDDSDRKHLTGRRTADRGDQREPERGPRPLFVAPDVPAWLTRVVSLPDETRPGGHPKPRVARLSGEG